MNESELKSLWQTANEKLEKTMAVNRVNSDDISQLKLYHFISSMRGIKLFTLLIGIIWVACGSVILSHIFLNGFSAANKFFLFSASFQVGLTAIALFIYIYQLITIYQVDISASILQTQKKIASLRMTTLLVTRILFLQLPVWTTFFWNADMFHEWSTFQLLITGTITMVFVLAAIWLFKNIKFENRDKKWFKLIFTGKEWTPLMQSMQLLEQLNEYKKESEPLSNSSS